MEDRIKRILTSKKLPEMIAKLSQSKRIIEKKGGLQCLFLLSMRTGRWKEAKEFSKRNNLHISDGTYRARMHELEHLKLAFHEDIGFLKKEYELTEQGVVVAEALLDFFEKMEPHV